MSGESGKQSAHGAFASGSTSVQGRGDARKCQTSGVLFHQGSAMQKKRPKHLDVGQIRLPVPGIVSILHRISGVVLFLFLPVFIYLLSGSLSSAADFETYQAVVGHPLVKLVLIGLLGLPAPSVRRHPLPVPRHSQGLELETARATAKATLVVSIALTLLIGGVLW